MRIQSLKYPVGLSLLILASAVLGHGVSGDDANLLESLTGLQVVPYMYLGAKHMFTGYDHLLFLAGVIFFLYRARDVAVYVSLFALGHSITLLTGVLAGLHINPYLVDAVIGLSVVYKGFENIGGFERMGVRIDTRKAVFLFGLVHGFGLSTKLQDLSLSEEGLIGNMLAFNVGVELGQLAALALMLVVFQWWRSTSLFERGAFITNVLIMTAGFLLFGYQLSGFFLAA